MIGIVILNYMTYEETSNCIGTIRATCKSFYRIYVVDNASPDGSFGRLLDTYSSDADVELIGSKVNKGYSAGNNIGVLKALEDGCTHILVSNSDIIYHEGAIDRLKQFLDGNIKAGIAGPRILDENGEVSEISRIFVKTGIMEKLFATTRLRSLNYRNIYRTYYGLDKSFDEIQKVYHLVGCCFMMKRELALKVVPFDENTFLYEEELILGIAAETAGYETYSYPPAEATHLNERSSRNIGAYALIHLVCSEIYYCRRYLKASRLKVFPIYMIRSMLYLERCLKNRSYRMNLGKYIRESARRFMSSDGLG
ncbi:glycosyltransferase [Youngiibacter multivorans]|nr:glycosyltransferase family 2 protein [Youngiibacter multivorans]